MKKISLSAIVMVFIFVMILGSFTGNALAQQENLIKVGMVGVDIKTAAIIVAESYGYFDEEGVEVEFEKISNLAEGLTAVDMGKLDILPFGVIPSATFVGQGSDVVVFGGTISEGSEIITKAEDEDFVGKKMGAYRMETGHMILKGYLREAGYELDKDYSLIYLDSMASIVEAIKKGELDLGFVNSGYGYIAEKSGLGIAAHVGDFVSDFPCCRQTTSRASLNNKRDALVKFEIAALRGYLTLQNDKEGSIKALTDYSGQDPEYVEAIIYGTEAYDPAMVISLDPNRKKVVEFYEVMKLNGDIDANTPYQMEDHIDTTIYLDAVNALLERDPENEILTNLLAEYAVNNE